MLHAAAAATAAAAAGHNPCTLFYGEGLCEAYAVLGRHTDAIAAASLQREQFPFNPFLQLHAQGVAGRSTAALGGDGAAAAAAAALAAAAESAARCKLPFLEVMLLRDMAVASGGEPAPDVLARLGRPLAQLVSGPAELDPLLGPGFSVAAALNAAAGAAAAS